MAPWLFYLFALPQLGIIHLWLLSSVAPFTLSCLLLLVTPTLLPPSPPPSPTDFPFICCPDVFSFGL